MQSNGVSIGGSNESLSDADDQANEAKNQEGSRGDSQAGEEAEAATGQDGQCGRREKGIPLAVFQREPGYPKAKQLRPFHGLSQEPPLRWLFHVLQRL